jgi:hypothetical protein
VRGALWQAITKLTEEGEKPRREPKDDDEFDAYVAYLLGSRWLALSQVVLLGSDRTGSFLVPAVNELLQAFQQFSGAFLQ